MYSKTIPIIAAMLMCILVGLLVLFQIFDASENIFNECYENMSLKYRYEGTGGLFGGTEKIYLHNESNNYDGKDILCVKGLGITNKYKDISNKYKHSED